MQVGVERVMALDLDRAKQLRRAVSWGLLGCLLLPALTFATFESAMYFPIPRALAWSGVAFPLFSAASIAGAGLAVAAGFLERRDGQSWGRLWVLSSSLVLIGAIWLLQLAFVSAQWDLEIGAILFIVMSVGLVLLNVRIAPRRLPAD